jgi:phage terminase large subunit-like protein
MANNVVVKQDPAGNIKPDKGKSIEKIDGIVSTIMALELAIRHGNEKGSIYNDREMRFL